MTADPSPAGRPKVLVPEKVSTDGLALLQKTLDVHEKKGLSAEQILEIIGGSGRAIYSEI
jgi:D-3-phosphoglycerate dehydrogenase / 2-oxoglutarate reductase